MTPTPPPAAPAPDGDPLVALVERAWRENRVDRLLATVQRTLNQLHETYLNSLDNHSRPAA